MFDTLGDLASSVVDSVSSHLVDAGEKAAKGAASALGNRLLEWVKAKLDDPVESGALEKLEAEPQSEGARQMFKGALLGRLEKDQTLAAELTALLKELGASGVPKSVLQTGPNLSQTDGQEADEEHQREANVEGPEGDTQQALIPDCLGEEPALNDQQQP